MLQHYDTPDQAASRDLFVIQQKSADILAPPDVVRNGTDCTNTKQEQSQS